MLETRGFSVRIWGGVFAALLFLAGDLAGANAAERELFMGEAVQPLAGTYEITTDANVRAGPRTGARRVAGLSRGTRVEAVGKAEGAWIAIRLKGKDLGFVYEPLLEPVELPPLERDADGHIIDEEGNPVDPASGYYVVSTDVNLRVKPTTEAPKRGGLDRGTKVEAIGAAKEGSWLAVRENGQELGFVFKEMLLPLVDGRLEEPLEGKTTVGDDIACAYEIRFSGKNPVEGELFETSDYEIDWDCDVDGREIAFPGFMFITEAPFQFSDNQVYQISMDLLGVVREYDEIFSTVFLYRRTEKKVVFDSVTMKDFGHEPEVSELDASTVVEALAAAARIAPAVWTEEVWDMLAKPMP